MTRLYAFLKKSPLENNRKILIAALCLLVIAGMVPRIYGLIRLPHEFFHNDGNEYRDISEQLYISCRLTGPYPRKSQPFF